MTEGFSSPVIGGGGGLVYPSIHSPNFITGSTGWTISKNGTAEFNNLVIRNGTVISGVQLVYAPSPGANNLIYSVAANAGSDIFGNFYFQGQTSYSPVTGGFNFAVSNNGNGFTWYSSATGQTGAPYSVAATQEIYDAGGGVFGVSFSTMVQAGPPQTWSDPYPLQDPNAGAFVGAIETWHPVVLAAGWATAAGRPVPSYRMSSDGDVQLVGTASHAAFAGSIAVSAVASPLPMAYQPAKNQVVPNTDNGTATYGGSVIVTTAGAVITSNRFPAGSVLIDFTGSYPLNL